MTDSQAIDLLNGFFCIPLAVYIIYFFTWFFAFNYFLT